MDAEPAIPLAETGIAAPANKIYDVLYRHRYRELDGLRGIASLMVGIDHAFGTVFTVFAASSGALLGGIAAGFFNGAVAVDLFFVMSGFFLAGMIENLPSRFLSRFYIRRLIRLVPPAIASVLVLYVYSRFALGVRPDYPLAAPAFTQFYTDNHNASFHVTALNFLLVRHNLNPVLWTIRLEIAASIIFPLVMFIKNRKSDFWYQSSWLGVFLILAIVLRNHQKLGLDVFHYLYIFYAGSLARSFGPAIRRLSASLQYILLALAVTGLVSTGEFDPTFGVHPILFDLPVTVFGTLLVILLAFGKMHGANAFINLPGIQFFGRISYSFYLINWLAVRGVGAIVLRDALPGRYGIFWTFIILLASSMAVNVALAYILHVLVESPSVALSRYFGQKPVDA